MAKDLGGKRPWGQKTWGPKDQGGKRPGGQKVGGQKTWGAKGLGAKDRGAKDWGGKVLSPLQTAYIILILEEIHAIGLQVALHCLGVSFSSYQIVHGSYEEKQTFFSLKEFASTNLLIPIWRPIKYRLLLE